MPCMQHKMIYHFTGSLQNQHCTFQLTSQKIMMMLCIQNKKNINHIVSSLVVSRLDLSLRNRDDGVKLLCHLQNVDDIIFFHSRAITWIAYATYRMLLIPACIANNAQFKCLDRCALAASFRENGAIVPLRPHRPVGGISKAFLCLNTTPNLQFKSTTHKQ